MANNFDNPELNDCGCCEGEPDLAAHNNPPGQPQLAYRLATQRVFLRRMKDRIALWQVSDGPQQGNRPLTDLTTREVDDPAIALLDSWATIADILTFYQERIAGEGYLRTATERRSILELARAIGYELGPGVAASAYLAFTVEDAPGAPDHASVPQGTRVQSIPAPGKPPQTFETSADLETWADWNAMRPRLSDPHPLDTALTRLYLDGVATNLRPGDLLLIVTAAGNTVAQRIQGVTADPGQGCSRIDFSTGSADPTPAAPYYPQGAVNDPPALPFSAEQIYRKVIQQRWDGADLDAFLTLNQWDRQALSKSVATMLTRLYQAGWTDPTTNWETASTLLDPSCLPSGSVYAFRTRSAIFGHNAPRWDTLKSIDGDGNPSNYPGKDWDNPHNDVVTDSYGKDHSPTIYLERSITEIVPQSWAALVQPGTSTGAYWISSANEISQADFAISGKVTALELQNADGSTPNLSGFKIRTTTAYAQSERRALAGLPRSAQIGPSDTSLELNGLLVGLRVGQPLILSGERTDQPGQAGGETLKIGAITHKGGYTSVSFAQPLEHTYRRASVTLNANVVLATHGETVHEVLGSGDGSQPNQQFTLKKPPLTYTAAATPSGGQSTLSVRLVESGSADQSGVLWQEAPSLYDLGPRDQDYTIRIDDDAKATVIFGDGQQGSRLSTGRENVVATYRSGIGPDGNVDAESLKLLQTRPYGIRDVTNTLAAGGGQAPQRFADAQQNAPLTVLTLERIVSLRDFESFARAFAGVGKAQAVALWQGEGQIVHLTVADSAGNSIERDTDLFTYLTAAIKSAHEPTQRVQVAGFTLLPFNVEAEVVIDQPRYVAADVLADCAARLEDAFSFARRGFGQPVTAAEVITIIQGAAGVIATTLHRLYITAHPPDPSQTEPTVVLPAATAQLTSAGFQQAELLLLNPNGLQLRKKQ